MAEADLMRTLQMAATRLGSRLMRQQTGMGWISNKVERGTKLGRMVKLYEGDVLLRKARAFHSGFDGWSDLGGFTPVEVTADMVGTTLPVYAQVEVKVNTKPTEQQMRWINFVLSVGGRAGIAHDETELENILSGAR